MLRSSRPLSASLVALWCGLSAAVAPASDSRVDFEREVRPLLAAHCLRCHGQADPEAGLDLTQRQTVLVAQAIVPHEPDSSELWRRVRATDDSRMPPDQPALAPGELDVLRRWIEQGANWPDHWAYAPIGAAEPPVTASIDCQNPVDAFLEVRQAELSLSPSPRADRRTLLRRLYFDVLGLPPSPQDVEEFLLDARPDAYERWVDRVLASPHAGERWARQWMDLVHFAETHGQEHDRPREHAWPYRDYLIRRFNADTPYDQFVQAQVAGDVLWPDDPDGVVATGMLAAGPWDESSLVAIQEESIDRLNAQYIDRDDIVSTVMSTFTSTSVHCARCHDHKFDPIRQTEYYGLQAVFAAIDKATRAYDADPVDARTRKTLEAQRARWSDQQSRAAVEALTQNEVDQFAAWEREFAARQSAWRPLNEVSATSAGGATLTFFDDGAIHSVGERPERDVVTVIAAAPAGTLTGLQLEVLRDDSLPSQGPGRAENGNFHLTEFRAAWVNSATGFEQPIALVRPRADFEQENWGIAAAFDGNPNTAWGVHPQEGQSHLARVDVATPAPAPAGCKLRIELHQLHGGGHVIGRFRIRTTGSEQPVSDEDLIIPTDVQQILAATDGERSDADRMRLLRWWKLRQIDEQLALLPPRSMIYCGTNQFVPEGSFRASKTPRTIHVLKRGMVTTPGDEATPGALSCIADVRFELAEGTAADEGARRAALATWLTHEQNVLTWRSIANRLWQAHFGEGLVSTPNDFGRMGSFPSHPELLDWLAKDLLERGMLLKPLRRRILTCLAYQRSSEESADQHEVDPSNRWLARQSRRRLDAEQFHDALLQAAGALDSSMHGPSVKQFIMTPSNTATPNIDYVNFPANDPARLRRGVYRFVYRTVPDPFMNALDCPDASQLTAQRNVSLTALQALATLNNASVIHQSHQLAARAGEATTDERGCVAFVYAQLLQRAPTDDEAEAVIRYATAHGWANACRMLLNLNEMVFVD